MYVFTHLYRYGILYCMYWPGHRLDESSIALITFWAQRGLSPPFGMSGTFAASFGVIVLFSYSSLVHCKFNYFGRLLIIRFKI